MTWYLHDNFKGRAEIKNHLNCNGSRWIKMELPDIDVADFDEYVSEICPEYDESPKYLNAMICLFIEKNMEIVQDYIKMMYHKV